MNKQWLLAAAAGSFLVALFHIGIIVVGAAGYRYFGAGEGMAQMADNGSSVPAIITSVLVLIFALWGAYALSGAGISLRFVGISQPLPFLRPVLLFIGGVYTLRGLAVVIEFAAQANLFSWQAGVRPQDPWFSLISLAIGISYLLGTLLKTPD